MADLGTLLVHLRGENGQLVATLAESRAEMSKTADHVVKQNASMKASFDALAMGVVGIGVGLIAGATLITEHVARWGASLAKLRSVSGMTGEQVSGLAAVAHTVGMEVDKLTPMLARFALQAQKSDDKSAALSNRLEDMRNRLAKLTAAYDPHAKNAKAAYDRIETLRKSVADLSEKLDQSVSPFARVGVAVRDATGNLRPLNDLLLDVADKFHAMPDGTAKAALAIQLFGKSGAAMIPILNLGRDGMKEITDEAAKLGVVVNDQTITSLRGLVLQQRELQEAWQGLNIQIAQLWLPIQKRVVDFVMTSIIPAFRQMVTWIDKNKWAIDLAGKAFVIFLGYLVVSKVIGFATGIATLAKTIVTMGASAVTGAANLLTMSVGELAVGTSATTATPEVLALAAAEDTAGASGAAAAAGGLAAFAGKLATIAGLIASIPAGVLALGAGMSVGLAGDTNQPGLVDENTRKAIEWMQKQPASAKVDLKMWGDWHGKLKEGMTYAQAIAALLGKPASGSYALTHPLLNARARADAANEARAAAQAAIAEANGYKPYGPTAPDKKPDPTPKPDPGPTVKALDTMAQKWGDLKTRVRSYFDMLHQSNLKAIYDARDAANKQIDEQKRVLYAGVESMRAGLRAQQQAREETRLRRTLADARAGGDQGAIDDATIALNDFLANKAIDSAQADADKQNEALDAEKAANDQKADAAAGFENARYKQQVADANSALAALQTNLKKQHATWSKAQTDIVALLKRFGVVYNSAGIDLGDSFMAGLAKSLGIPVAKLFPQMKKASVPGAGGAATGEAAQPLAVYTNLYLDGKVLVTLVNQYLFAQGRVVAGAAVPGSVL